MTDTGQQLAILLLKRITESLLLLKLLLQVLSSVIFDQVGVRGLQALCVLHRG